MDKILTYCTTVPHLQVQDIFKYLYQSCFGCEHLVTEYEPMRKRIEEEKVFADSDTLPETEMLDGDFGRVHLKMLHRGLSEETLCRLFLLSAKEKAGSRELLTEKIRTFTEYVRKGQTPFTENEWQEALAEWEENGFAPCHHSDVFRNATHPAYRVIHKKYIDLLPLLIAIDKALQTRETVTVALDGRCAAGKTTAAGLLQEIYGCTVFHMDDFFLRPEQRTPERFAMPGGNVDRERFLSEVLEPLSRKETVQYRRYDCHSQTVEEPILCPPARLTVTEGVYSLHPSLQGYYTLKAFMDISPDLQKKRIEKRNPAMAQRFFREWIPLEEAYFQTFSVRTRCDVVIEQQD